MTTALEQFASRFSSLEVAPTVSPEPVCPVYTLDEALPLVKEKFFLYTVDEALPLVKRKYDLYSLDETLELIETCRKVFDVIKEDSEGWAFNLLDENSCRGHSYSWTMDFSEIDIEDFVETCREIVALHENGDLEPPEDFVDEDVLKDYFYDNPCDFWWDISNGASIDLDDVREKYMENNDIDLSKWVNQLDFSNY